jgi:hypothetical protein
MTHEEAMVRVAVRASEAVEKLLFEERIKSAKMRSALRGVIAAWETPGPIEEDELAEKMYVAIRAVREALLDGEG